MEMFIGLLMFALWGYAIYIIINKVKDTTTTEKVALFASLGFLVLFIIGASMEDEYVAPAIPTKYECLQLGSDSARAMCINQYYK